ncbi:hypothetical protein HDF22_004940 [Mucilaginibacter lappiensis]|uniref:Uncharacterized protein n=1 Tax=Mucilaginibacter lappiensis TaxID=354630 RepID=A0A841JR77_9SPHI|nr:hypothetical protein [Mucilaginibacter lappiensis]
MNEDYQIKKAPVTGCLFYLVKSLFKYYQIIFLTLKKIKLNKKILILLKCSHNNKFRFLRTIFNTSLLF